MSAKTIIFDTRAREKILRGVDTLADADDLFRAMLEA